ncbi:type II secretion system protein GspL [Endozoicomonas arenosclerae]|uniref:type II secretion system protein GspL n=1 Tax=Endozoicomonas arenosclerae TaxID=1633495 RepID=UPI0007802F05|nr:type II secretion system protein GspL [Endozoicomonas arenosclerae]
MSQHLIIRLPGDPGQPVHWQLYPVEQGSVLQETGEEKASSGVLSSIEALSVLAEQFPDTKTIALVPAELVSVHSLQVEGSLSKAVMKSLPFRLEDDLAEDVEDLHISVIAKEDDQVYVSVVAQSKMAFWYEALNRSELKFKVMIPETLALPWTEGECSALKLEDRWLLRDGRWQWATCDPSWLNFYLAEEEGSEEEPLKVNSFSEVPENCPGEWYQESSNSEDPMAVLAAGAVNAASGKNNANLLQGPWQVESSMIKSLKPWGLAAGLLAFTITLFAAQAVLKSIQLEQQADQLQAQAHEIYSDMFPGERVVRLQSQMRQKLAALKSNHSNDSGLLKLLDQTAPLFKQHPELKPVTLSYNQSQQSLRLEATAKDFDTFTAFREESGEQLVITVETLEKSGDLANGTLIIRGNDS